MMDWMLAFREPLPRTALAKTQRTLDVDVQHQEQTNWCWAAVSVSVEHFYDRDSPWTQCRMANEELTRQDCCGPAGATDCNQYGYLDSSLSRVGRLDRMTYTSESFTAVMSTIDRSNPLGCRTAWRGGGAHFVVIQGYVQATPGTTEQDMISVDDPWTGKSSVAYDQFVRAYQGQGTWTHSYFCRR